MHHHTCHSLLHIPQAVDGQVKVVTVAAIAIADKVEEHKVEIQDVHLLRLVVVIFQEIVEEIGELLVQLVARHHQENLLQRKGLGI